MKKLISILLCFIISFLLVSCDKPVSSTPVSLSHFCLDTTATITIYQMNDMSNASNLIHECFSICDSFEQEISKTIKSSIVSKINQNSGVYTPVSETVLSLTKDSIKFSKQSNGAFDITICPITELWDIKNNSGIIPTKKQIQNTLKNVNYKEVKIKNNSIYIPPNFKIDFGGISKGYLADMLKLKLTSKGVTSAIINLGGNILTIGKKNESENFSIGIQKPFREKGNDFSAIISASNMSVVTSGIYERYFKKDNVFYHHIFDTKTGYPVQNNLYSVTVLSDSSEDGDALSTSLLIMGKEKGIKYVNNLEGIEAVFIDSNYNITLSNGLSMDSNNMITLSNNLS